jgi:hypothetical protein
MTRAAHLHLLPCLLYKTGIYWGWKDGAVWVYRVQTLSSLLFLRCRFYPLVLIWLGIACIALALDGDLGPSCGFRRQRVAAGLAYQRFISGGNGSAVGARTPQVCLKAVYRWADAPPAVTVLACAWNGHAFCALPMPPPCYLLR